MRNEIRQRIEITFRILAWCIKRVAYIVLQIRGMMFHPLGGSVWWVMLVLMLDSRGMMLLMVRSVGDS